MKLTGVRVESRMIEGLNRIVGKDGVLCTPGNFAVFSYSEILLGRSCIGILKSPYFKQALDPLNILNPGIMLQD